MELVKYVSILDEVQLSSKCQTILAYSILGEKAFYKIFYHTPHTRVSVNYLNIRRITFRVSCHGSTKRILFCPTNSEEYADLGVLIEVPFRIKFPWLQNFLFCAPFKVTKKTCKSVKLQLSVGNKSQSTLL